jgi:hypothetical protein
MLMTVILSTSHAGLQNRLHQLEKYCDAWCLKVNNTKSRLLCSIRQAGKYLEKFKFQNYDIECGSNYKYLGIHLTASGSFHFAQTELYKKALKAYYKLRKDFFSLNPSVKSSMHIFDHTLKPILLYNSEVWGSYHISSDRLNTRAFDLDNIFKSSV